MFMVHLAQPDPGEHDRIQQDSSEPDESAIDGIHPQTRKQTMAPPKIQPTGRERTFGRDEIIVSKTDPKGRITYANDVFLRVSGYREDELLGQPHNIIRHPGMPRCVFQLLWDTIRDGREIFAYVVNLAKNGDHYWVFAHVTPTFSADGTIIGYHSNRRVPSRSAVRRIEKIYEVLLQAERPHRIPRDAVAASGVVLKRFLREQGVAYDEFIFRLAGEEALQGSPS